MSGLIVFDTSTGGFWLLELIPHCEKKMFERRGFRAGELEGHKGLIFILPSLGCHRYFLMTETQKLESSVMKETESFELKAKQN